MNETGDKWDHEKRISMLEYKIETFDRVQATRHEENQKCLREISDDVKGVNQWKAGLMGGQRVVTALIGIAAAIAATFIGHLFSGK